MTQNRAETPQGGRMQRDCFLCEVGNGLLYKIPLKSPVVSFCMSRFKIQKFYRGADKSLARPTSRCILFDSENI
jgi:hypothetical protein